MTECRRNRVTRPARSCGRPGYGWQVLGGQPAAAVEIDHGLGQVGAVDGKTESSTSPACSLLKTTIHIATSDIWFRALERSSLML